MRRIRLYILAPNDRFNYGDLLFPYVLRYALPKDLGEFIYCSTSESDLSQWGGVETKGFNVLYELDPNYDNYLIIAGGEGLFAPWASIISFFDKRIDKLIKQVDKFRLRKFLGANLVSKILQSIVVKSYNIKTYFPFTIGKSEVQNLKGVFYNAVGGGGLVYNKEFKREFYRALLEDSQYISVRDQNTSDYLDSIGITHTLVPDSVIIISNIFNESILYNRVNEKIKKQAENSEYIFFQIRYSIWQKEKHEVIAQLRLLLAQYKICLCPIGTALGHSDDLSISEIIHTLHSQNIIKIESPTIWDIMWLIKHSKLYIGTSLHGIITSMSYNVPYISHSQLKIKTYLETWGDNNFQHFCNISDIYNVANGLINSPYSFDVQKQKDMVMGSIKRIEQIISSNSKED